MKLQGSPIMTRGMSLIELVISIGIFAVMTSSALGVYLTGMDAYETASAYITAETMLQMKLDEVMDELAETAESNLTIYSWVDPLLGTNMQESLCFSSARDTTGQFVTLNGRPSWQSVVVFAPYSQNNRGQIRRYESFGAYTFPITVISVTTSQIILSNGVTFNRDSGRIIIGNVSALDAQAMLISMQNPISVSIKVRIYLPKGYTKEVTLQSYVDCRNADAAGTGGLYDE